MKPNGRDHNTDPVLKRLVYSDHATLILARHLQAQGPHTEGFQILDVHDDDKDDDGNRGHISDVSVSHAEPDDIETAPAISTDPAPPPTEEQQPPASGGNVENVILTEPQSQGGAEVTQTATTEGQQQEGATEAVTAEEEDLQDEETQAAIAGSLGVALPRARDEDEDSQPEQKFKCTVPGCDKKFSEHHELKGTSSYHSASYPVISLYATVHIHEHDDKPYGCSLKGCTRTYSTQRERDRHVSIHRLTRQFGLPGFGSPGDTETTVVEPTSVSETQPTGSMSSILVSTSLPPGVNPPPATDAPVVGSPPQA